MDPFEPYLRERWAQGEHNSAQLFTEIQEQGFSGSAALIRQRLARWRVRPGHTNGIVGSVCSDGQPKRSFSPRQTLWLLLGDRSTTQQNQKDVQAQAYVVRLRELSPTIQQAQGLLVQFRQLLRARESFRLSRLVTARTSQHGAGSAWVCVRNTSRSLSG